MYFVHSYCVRPSDPAVVLASSRFGGHDFCSALGKGNITGCQFHPEKSGRDGLGVYRNIARLLRQGGAAWSNEPKWLILPEKTSPKPTTACPRT